MASLTFTGKSQYSDPFTCSNIIGAVTDALGLLDLPAVIGRQMNQMHAVPS